MKRLLVGSTLVLALGGCASSPARVSVVPTPVPKPKAAPAPTSAPVVVYEQPAEPQRMFDPPDGSVPPAQTSNRPTTTQPVSRTVRPLPPPLPDPGRRSASLRSTPPRETMRQGRLRDFASGIRTFINRIKVARSKSELARIEYEIDELQSMTTPASNEAARSGDMARAQDNMALSMALGYIKMGDFNAALRIANRMDNAARNLGTSHGSSVPSDGATVRVGPPPPKTR